MGSTSTGTRFNGGPGACQYLGHRGIGHAIAPGRPTAGGAGKDRGQYSAAGIYQRSAGVTGAHHAPQGRQQARDGTVAICILREYFLGLSDAPRTRLKRPVFGVAQDRACLPGGRVGHEAQSRQVKFGHAQYGHVVGGVKGDRLRRQAG